MVNLLLLLLFFVKVKGPCLHKQLCVFVFLFSNSLFADFNVLIGCHFSNDNFKSRKFAECLLGDNEPLT